MLTQYVTISEQEYKRLVNALKNNTSMRVLNNWNSYKMSGGRNVRQKRFENKNVKNLIHMNKVLPTNTEFSRILKTVMHRLRPVHASNTIKRHYKNFKSRINSPSKRTIKNPTWIAKFLRESRAFERRGTKPKIPQNKNEPNPNIPKNLRWINFGTRKEAFGPNGTMYTYFPNRNLLRISNKNGPKSYTNVKRFLFPLRRT